MKGGALNAELEIRGARTEADLRAANDLFARTQLLDDHLAKAWLESAGKVWPGFHPKYVRLAIYRERIVGALRVIEVPLRIGQARLHAGGIGWVSTDCEFRGQGVCAALMADTHAFMLREQFVLSLLFGIPDLYHRYGYVAAIPERNIVVDLDSLPAGLCCRHRTRDFTSDDYSSMVALHNTAETEASSSIVREERWVKAQTLSGVPKTPYWADWKSAVALVDGHNTLAGWLMPQAGREELHIKDLGATDEAACESLLATAADMARERALSRLRFHVPPFHLFARFLEGFDSIHETRFFRDREGMLAILDVEKTLRAMTPEWQHRLDVLPHDPDFHQLNFIVDGVLIRIAFRQGKVLIKRDPTPGGVELGTTRLLLLLSGCRRAQDVLGPRWDSLLGPARRMIEVLFPRREPFIWPIDHF